MNQKRHKLAVILLLAMIAFGFAMSVFSFIFINQASVDTQYPNAGIGTFTAWILNIVMALLGAVGLILERFGKRRIVRILLFLLLIVSLADMIPSMAYGLFTLPLVIALPAIFLLTVK